MIPGAETVIRHRGAGLDKLGNPTTPSAPLTITGCAVYPRGSNFEEVGARQALLLDGYTVLVPANADGTIPDIRSTDLIEWARMPGRLAQVMGDIAIYPFLDGELAGVEVSIRYEEG